MRINYGILNSAIVKARVEARRHSNNPDGSIHYHRVGRYFIELLDEPIQRMRVSDIEHIRCRRQELKHIDVAIISSKFVYYTTNPRPHSSPMDGVLSWVYYSLQRRLGVKYENS